MVKNIFKIGGILAIASLIMSGCATVTYVGEPFDTTTDIETFYSADDIDREYTLIGHATGLGVFMSNNMVHRKLVKSAQLKGADAILITGIGKSEILISTGLAVGENQVYAAFIKYKQ